MSSHRLWLSALHALLLHAVLSSAGPTPPRLRRSNPEQNEPLGRVRLQQRDSVTADQLLTCGFADGDPDRPRTAQPGFDCRVDTAHGIWGFCPTTVVQATDCGLAAACKDSGTCSSVCKFNSGSSLTTFTCASSGTDVQYCSTAILTFGVDQSYGYLACGSLPETVHLFISATATPTTATSTSPSTAATAAKTTSPTAPRTRVSASPTAPTKTAVAPTAPTTTAPVPAATSSAASTTSMSALPAGSDTKSTNNVGAIVGGVLGGLALVCASAIAAVYIVKKHNANGAAAPFAPGSDLSAAAAAPPYAAPKHQSLYEVDSSSSVQFPYIIKPQPPLPPLPQEASAGYPGYSGYAVELPSNPA